MPKIQEYLNIAFFFYSNEYEPIHVHSGNETVFEIIIEKQEVKEIKKRKVRGREHLEQADLKNAQDFVNVYAKEIVRKWVDFFVYKTEIKLEKISKNI